MQHRFEGSPVWPPSRQGLYDPANEHDACGLGFIAHIKGQKRHAIITQALLDPSEPLPPRSDGRRSAARRRRGHPDPVAGPLPAQGVRRPGPHAAGGGPVRRRHGVPAERAGIADGLRAGDRACRGERRTDPARLAQRADEQSRPVRANQGSRARHPPGLHRPRLDGDGPGRARAEALHHPQEIRPCDPGAQAAARQGVLCHVDVVAHDRLQGNAARAPGRRVLRRPERRVDGLRAGDGAPALFDQHVPDVGSRASVPDGLPQRRDQHAARQRQLDPRAAAGHREHGAGRGPGQDLAADLRRPVRFGVVRQRARAARHGRLFARARDDADDPGSMGGQSADGRGSPRLLRIPRGADGAVGRTRGDGLHRRPPDRRDARSQRPAAGALRRHRRRLHRDGLGGRRARHPRAQDRHQVAAAAGQDAARRHRAGPHHRRCRVEAHARDGEALPALDRALAHRARRPARSGAAAADRRAVARSPAGVRLHAGGPEDHPRADGALRRGGDRVDGQRRRAAGAVAAAEGALQLLQAAVRAGDQSADRSDPRRARHVARHVHRSAAEPARGRRSGGRREPSDAARGDAADPDEQRDGEDPPRGALHGRRVQDLRARHLLSGRVGRERHGGGARFDLGRRGRRDQPGLQHPRRVRPQGVGGADADSRAARHGGRPPAPRPQGAAHEHGSRRRDRVGARSAPLRAARGLRRGGRPSLSRARDARHAVRRSPRVAAGARVPLHQGDLEGALQGDVEDGHLHVPVVLRRADLRGRRPAARLRRQVLHRHREQRRGHRSLRDRGRGVPDASGGVRPRPAARQCARRGRRVHVPHPRRRPHVDAGLDRQAAARGAHRQRPDVQGVCRADQRSDEADAHAARAVRVQVRARVDPARGRRACRGDRASASRPAR